MEKDGTNKVIWGLQSPDQDPSFTSGGAMPWLFLSRRLTRRAAGLSERKKSKDTLDLSRLSNVYCGSIAALQHCSISATQFDRAAACSFEGSSATFSQGTVALPRSPQGGLQRSMALTKKASLLPLSRRPTNDSFGPLAHRKPPQPPEICCSQYDVRHPTWNRQGDRSRGMKVQADRPRAELCG